MSPSSPHAAPHGVTLTLRLVALVGAFDAPPFRPCFDLDAPLSTAYSLWGSLEWSSGIPPFRKSQKNFSAFRRHYSSWPPTVGASGEFRYIYRSSSLSDNVQRPPPLPRGLKDGDGGLYM
ncbi:hypothetical protein EDB85DRAFT_2158838 [Lactarius pseudohatsudake]|nr:hypothetical protein EDB85DRAFT_2158838 [Lactarius pseudohatsudake]